jgi:hypothetical protein
MKLIRMKHLPSRAKRFVQSQFHAHWRTEPIKPGTVLYESFSGNGMLCNPEAIFRQLLATPDMHQLTHIWVLSDLRQYRTTIAEFAGTPNVTMPHPQPVAAGHRPAGPALPRAVVRCRCSGHPCS